MAQDKNTNLNTKLVVLDAAQADYEERLLEHATQLDASYQSRGSITLISRGKDGSNFVYFLEYSPPGYAYGSEWPDWVVEIAKVALGLTNR